MSHWSPREGGSQMGASVRRLRSLCPLGHRRVRGNLPPAVCTGLGLSGKWEDTLPLAVLRAHTISGSPWFWFLISI